VLLGLGLGLAFPAHGLAGLVMAAAALAAPLLRRDGRALLISLLVALPLATAWPVLLGQQAPELWANWWNNELAEATLGRGLPEGRHLEQLLWGAWPVLPLALWSLWLHRHRSVSLLLPLLGTLITLAWYLSGSSRSLGILPTLIPLTLLAAAGADRLRRGIANAFDWFALTTFSFAAGLIWLGASAQVLGWPPRIARNFEKLAPGHEAGFSLLTLVFAATLTAGWLLTWRLRRAGWRPSLRWAAGTTLMWALAATLWLSWIDHSKTYRPVVASLRAALPATVDCIDRVGVGVSQRAALDYFAGIRTEPPARKRQCRWRLSIDDKGRPAPRGWTEIWQGGRSSDRKERWYLDRRND
jgi:4-amino-4-deoxy-L-arabinose transferase-like glycosyltransferase